MIFSITRVRCIYSILNILQQRESNYAQLYKQIRMSHITLQTALKSLLKHGLVGREDKGHKKSFYQITNKGTKYFFSLKELYEIEKKRG